MTNNIEIPEELEEMIKSIISYEDINETDEDIERELEWAREWAYIDPPDLHRRKDSIEDVDEEESWKIEISL